MFAFLLPRTCLLETKNGKRGVAAKTILINFTFNRYHTDIRARKRVLEIQRFVGILGDRVAAII